MAGKGEDATATTARAWFNTSIGRVSGNANALTVVLPLKRGASPILGSWLWLLRRRNRVLRKFAVGTLHELRFVSAIRWSLLPPRTSFPRRPGEWLAGLLKGDNRWSLLFESNFDGDWDDYLDVFGAVQPLPLSSIIYWGRGFPGLEDVALFKAYAKAFDHEPDHYVSAYPELTSGDIYQELFAREGDAAAEVALDRGLGAEDPRWTTLLLPIEEGRGSEAIRVARDLDRPSDGDPRSLFLRTGCVHFARVVVLPRTSGSWLLITMTHDGTSEQVIRRLVAKDRAHGAWVPSGLPPGVPADYPGVDTSYPPPSSGDSGLSNGAVVGGGRPSTSTVATADRGTRPSDAEPGGTPLRRLFECCRGVPSPSEGWWDDARLISHLLEARPRGQGWYMAYCGYPGRSVQNIRNMNEEPVRNKRMPGPTPT